MNLGKAYTREFTVLMGQVWLYAFMQLLKKLPPKELKVPYVEFRCNGAIEYWEDSTELQRFLDALLLENIKSRSFFDQAIVAYKRAEEFVKSQRAPVTTQEFIEGIEVLIDGVAGWTVMYYSALDERTPIDIHDEAKELRAQDSLGDDGDEYMRRGLTALFPKLGNGGRAVSFDELKSSTIEAAALETRDKGAVIYVAGQELQIVPGTLENFQTSNPQYHFVRDSIQSDTRILEGQVGYKGYAKGMVRILRRRDQVEEIETGDILVSPMTTPHFVAAIKKAAAIVTDEGGVTCHAAILARELKKPCIIGTKFATQVLKNGDMVEVDANTGVVRKLT